MPMISQITSLTWAERIGSSSVGPSGTPSASVTMSVTLWTLLLVACASSSTVVRLAGRSVIGSGSVTVRPSSVARAR